jgi:hypothetical protein
VARLRAAFFFVGELVMRSFLPTAALYRRFFLLTLLVILNQVLAVYPLQEDGLLSDQQVLFQTISRVTHRSHQHSHSTYQKNRIIPHSDYFSVR